MLLLRMHPIHFLYPYYVFYPPVPSRNRQPDIHVEGRIYLFYQITAPPAQTKVEEKKMIRKKMILSRTANMGAYLRKMAIDGIIVNTDTTYLEKQFLKCIRSV